MKKILFLSNHFITLYSFRKELIVKLLKEGHQIYISMPADPQNEYFVDMGCAVIETKISRRGMNPVEDIKLVLQYKKIMKNICPDIVFSYTIKPNIYGCVASNLLHIKQVCNITGTGSTFLEDSMLNRIACFLYRHSIKKAYKVFFQNSGDKEFFVVNKLVENNYAMLPGSGVNLEQHQYVPMPHDEQIKFIFIGRVMKLKGIDEYLSCAKHIKESYPNTCFYIAGWDEEVRYKEIMAEYEANGIITYIGFQKDISVWIQKCHCTVLPSHGGEGIPNVVLETAATGRPCIVSKVNGSQDAVDDGVTGFVFEPRNSVDLQGQVERFLNESDEKRAQMGRDARKKVEREFDREIVIKAYLDEIAQSNERNYGNE